MQTEDQCAGITLMEIFRVSLLPELETLSLNFNLLIFRLQYFRRVCIVYLDSHVIYSNWKNIMVESFLELIIL